MTLGRMIYFFLGPDPANQHIFGVKAKRFTLLFVGLDITAFLIQGIGGAMSSGNPSEDTLNLEFASGANSSVRFHEWFQYVFDGVPMLFALIALHIVHPGRFLQGKESEFPARSEKRAIKKAQKAEARAVNVGNNATGKGTHPEGRLARLWNGRKKSNTRSDVLLNEV
ncbi:MAG: hypothetical protein Q9227_008296 [Pyrenula ochraceoflavens]